MALQSLLGAPRPFNRWAVGVLCLLIACTFKASAIQITFDFGKNTIGQIPPGFISLTTGDVKGADWRVAQESVPPILAPVSGPSHTSEAKRPVLEALSPASDSSPLLVYTNEIFDDFTLTTRFKISGGPGEGMAGLAFRIQDENNYYVVRASSQGNLLWYRVVGGKSYENLGVGVLTPMPKDTWRELRVECSASQIRCFLDDKLAIPPVKAGAPTKGVAVNDTTFVRGQVGFWCKAGSQCSFADANVRYSPKVPFAEVVVADMKKKYPRLLGLKIYADKSPGSPVVVGDVDSNDLGTAGSKYDQDVIDRGSVYYLKDGGAIEVTMPLRDRNGDVAAALKTRLKSFPGETKETALTRASIIKKAIEQRMSNMQGITE